METEISRLLLLNPTPVAQRMALFPPPHAERVDTPLSLSPACYRSDERFLCNKRHCAVSDDCKRLVAEWLR